MWRIGHRHELPHLFEVVQVLQAKPYRFGAGSTIAFASEIAAESSYPCNGLTQCRRISWGNGFFLDMGIKCLPFGLFEKHSAGDVGRFTAQFDQVEDAPGDNHIDSEAGFDTAGAAQLTFFDLATAFQRAMVNLDSPSARIPSQFFDGLRAIGHRTGG